MDVKALSFSLKPYSERRNGNSDLGVCLCVCVGVYACVCGCFSGELRCHKAQGHCGSSITTAAGGGREGRKWESKLST